MWYENSDSSEQENVQITEQKFESQDNIQKLIQFKSKSPILESIINAFINCSNQNQILDTIISYFPLKKSSSAQCTTYFDGPCNYYKCFDCQKHEDACLCQECFIKGNHQKHRFQARWTKGGNGSCDCGNQDVWKKQGFCSMHTGHMSEVRIQKGQQQKFKSVFEVLFSIHYNKYVKNRDQFKKILFSILIKLNDQSPIYNYLTRKVLCEKNNYEQSRYLDFILCEQVKEYSTLEDKLIIKMIAQNEFKLEVTKKFIICRNTIPKYEGTNCYKKLCFQLMANTEIINELAEQGVLFYPKKQLRNHEYYSRLNFVLSNNLIPEKLVKGLLQNNFISENKELIDFLSMVTTGLKDNQQIQILTQQKLILHVISNSKQIDNLSQLVQITWLYFVYASQGNIQALLNKNLYKKLFPTKKIICQYLRVIFINEILNKNTQAFTSIGLFFITLLLQKQEKQKLFSQIWSEILLSLMKLHDEQNSKILSFIQVGVRLELTLYSISKIKSHVHFYMSNYFDCPSSVNQLVRQLIEQRLYSHGPQLAKQEFLQILQNLKVMNQNYQFAKTLVSPLQNNKYKYIGKDLGIKTKNRVKLDTKAQNIRVQSYFALTPAMQYLATIITPNVIGQYLKLFDKLPQLFSNINQLQNRKYVLFAYSVLIFMDNFYSGSNTAINEKIQQTKTFLNNVRRQLTSMQEAQRKFYETVGKMFGIDDLLVEFETKNKYKQELKLQQRKRFIEEIKKKKFEEIMAKQRKIQIQQKSIESDNAIQQDSQICLFCRQTANKSNELYFLACISQVSGLQALYNQKQLDYQVELCKHLIHKDCFLTYLGQKLQSFCPLCKFPVNCIVPNIKQENRSYWQNEQEWIGRINFFLEIVQQSDKKLYSKQALVYKKSFLNILKTKIFNPQLKENADRQIYKLIKNYYNHGTKQQKDKFVQCFKQLKKAYEQADNIAGKLKLYTLELIELQIKGKMPSFDDSLTKFKKIIDQQLAALLLSSFYPLENPEKIDGQFPVATIFKKLQTKIQMAKLPNNAAQFIETRTVKCNVCSSINSSIWNCLICQQSKCSNCQEKEEHCNSLHGNASIFLIPNKAELILKIGGNNYKSVLYQNQLQEEWEPNKIKQNPRQFRLRQENVEKAYQFLLAYWFSR